MRNGVAKMKSTEPGGKYWKEPASGSKPVDGGTKRKGTAPKTSASKESAKTTSVVTEGGTKRKNTVALPKSIEKQRRKPEKVVAPEELSGDEEDGDEQRGDLEMVDVETAIIKCKAPPPKLLVADWEKKGLCGTCLNPKRFPHGAKPEAVMGAIFGRRFGRVGRNGYKWQEVKDKVILDRILELHPIIYQHHPDHMPSYLKILFAEGIVHEQENGPGSINWAAFAQEVNQTQRRMRGSKKGVMEYIKETGVTKVMKAELKMIKLEVDAEYDPASSKKDVFEVCASRIPTKQEDDLSSSAAERIQRLTDLERVLTLEIAYKKSALATSDKQVKRANDVVRAHKENLKYLDRQIKDLQGENWTGDNPEVLFRVGVFERMKGECRVKLETAVVDVQAAEAARTKLQEAIELQGKQLASINDEASHLKLGGRPFGLSDFSKHNCSALVK